MGVSDVFVYDRQTDTIECVSLTADGTTGNAYSSLASISADGRYVAFMSSASNLVPGDTNATTDIFVYDRQTHSIERVSVATNGTQANGQSVQPTISADGRFVKFIFLRQQSRPRRHQCARATCSCMIARRTRSSE